MDAPVEMKWFEIIHSDVEGIAWKNTENPFDRLPACAKGLVTENVWISSHSATGVQLDFLTDSSVIRVRWTLGSEQLGEPNFNVIACSGFDLYARGNSGWRWAGTTPHFVIRDTHPEAVLLSGVSRMSRMYRLYFPLRNPVLKLEIGVEKDASFEKFAPRAAKPVVWYGSSIVHGAFSVRAGLALSSALGRAAELPVVNLGYSGAAKMEKNFADLLAGVDASCFIIDALPNMTPELVRERTEIFLRTLWSAHPQTPVVLLEDQENMGAWLKPDQMRIHREKWKLLSLAARKLRKEGMPLSYVRGRTLFGTDGEGTMDGIHPNDLGIFRMGKIVARVVKKALGQP